MMRFNWMIMGLSLLAGSCSEDEVGTEQPVEPPIAEEKKTDLYPKPPSGWMGEADPYNTTGWVGDIMPYYDNGEFHIFFLHDAQTKPAGEGFHAIHKFQSNDLVDFSYEGEMIPYGGVGDPDFAIGTGSPVKVGETYFFYYTGHNGNASFVQNNPRESVLLATSTDLENWTKQEEFKITAPAGYYDFDFRDPHVFFNEEENEYWMLISTQTSARKAVVLLYTSQDPENHQWELQEPVYTTTNEENYLMLECADMFKMGNYWYMFFSENWTEKATHYRFSSSSKGPWTIPENDLLDGEFFYAAKTAGDESNRYLFGWTARRIPENNKGNKEWAGNMVVHQLTQAADGTLGVKIPIEVTQLVNTAESLELLNSFGSVIRTDKDFELDGTQDLAMQKFTALNGTRRIQTRLNIAEKGSAGFVLIADSAPQENFEILIEPSEGRIAAYRVSGGQTQLINEVPIETQSEYNLDLVLEGSIAVLYIEGEVAFSNRIYDMVNQEWGIIAKGTIADFDNMEIYRP